MSAATATMEGNQTYSRVTKMDRLNARVSKLLTVAVQEVLDLVKETVSEYQEKTARTQRENDRLRQRLREAVGRLESERAAADRRAQLASVFERAVLQERQQQQLGDIHRRGSPAKQSDPPEEHQDPLVIQLSGLGGGGGAEQEVEEEQEEQKLTPDTLTECAVSVQLMFTEHSSEAGTDRAAVTADDELAMKPHVGDARPIKCDSNASPVSPEKVETVNMAIAATSIPSPCNKPLPNSSVHPLDPECVKIEPASPGSPNIHQEAPLSSIGLSANQTPISPIRSLPITSRTLNSSSSATAGPYNLLFGPVSTQHQPQHPQPPQHHQQPPQHHQQPPQHHQQPPQHHQQPPQHHQQPPQQQQDQRPQRQQQQVPQGLGRRLGSGLGFSRTPRLFNGGESLRRSHHHLNHYHHHQRQAGGARRYDPQTCGVCGKTFSRLGNLRIHERCHTGEKPYGCTECGRFFSQAGDLKKHQRVHTGEKPYYCSQCGKSFSRGENLRRHQKIHAGQRGGLQLPPQHHQAWTGARQTQR